MPKTQYINETTRPLVPNCSSTDEPSGRDQSSGKRGSSTASLLVTGRLCSWWGKYHRRERRRWRRAPGPRGTRALRRGARDLQGVRGTAGRRGPVALVRHPRHNTAPREVDLASLILAIRHHVPAVRLVVTAEATRRISTIALVIRGSCRRRRLRRRARRRRTQRLARHAPRSRLALDRRVGRAVVHAGVDARQRARDAHHLPHLVGGRDVCCTHSRAFLNSNALGG